MLDLGCGAGSTSVFLAKNFGASVYAVDKQYPDSLSGRAAEAGVGQLVVPIRADSRELPFPNEHFDVVFSMNFIFFISAPMISTRAISSAT